MKRKPRDYSYELKPNEPLNISESELANLSFTEMMLKANGVPKKEKHEQIKTSKSVHHIRVRQDGSNDKA